ncbi:MAG: bifunctional demethylmenaquinone methyltransferase/2-methoxy-6-polyprenyl-1,4-benzoquinol methylase UbiE [Gammaproteobacteria bacterium]|nr:MAG: bifunctional demethylmenaquinone methyltransferase/2-methoxy-6-polyprenyl-1,4-benzoquinol methylase UbiE [Gammaproteobacteria bacterium]
MSTADSKKDKTTHFGYRDVSESEKAGLVADVFHSVARKYDVMNDVMSFGAHRLWKRFAVGQSGVRAGQRVLDLAGGTGDLTRLFSKRVGADGEIVTADINNSMLEVGRERLIDQGLVKGIFFVQCDAESLPFVENSFDCVVIAFGLRNVTRKQRALESMYRVLRPGGVAMILEFSKPALPGLNKIYDFYSFTALPFMGRVIVDDEDSYRYLAESIRKHPDQETLKGMMETAGFERTHYFNLSGGIVALHKGHKL